MQFLSVSGTKSPSLAQSNHVRILGYTYRYRTGRHGSHPLLP